MEKCGFLGVLWARLTLRSPSVYSPYNLRRGCLLPSPQKILRNFFIRRSIMYMRGKEAGDMARRVPPDLPPRTRLTASEEAGFNRQAPSREEGTGTVINWQDILALLEQYRKMMKGHSATPARDGMQPAAASPAKATAATPPKEKSAPSIDAIDAIDADETGRRVYRHTLLPSGDPASREPVTRGGRN